MTKTYPIDSDFIVRVSRAKMPSKCWGRYSHVAVLEVAQGVSHVSAIDERLRVVRSIPAYWGRQHEGKTERCAAGKARAAAQRIADRLNRKQAQRRARAAKRAAQAEAADVLESSPALDAIALAT